jgi:hypothetical protein
MHGDLDAQADEYREVGGSHQRGTVSAISVKRVSAIAEMRS